MNIDIEEQICDEIVFRLARDKGIKVSGLVMVYVGEESGNKTIDTVRVIKNACDPSDLMDGIVDVAMDIVEEYDLEDYKP